jgi:uncharacterized phiE125 gp8 family phage protein
MILVELAEVPAAILPTARLRDQLRLGTGFADDGVLDPLLQGFLRAAIAAVEARTGKALLSRAFELTVGAWHRADRQPIPIAPVGAVSGVALLDGVGGAISVPLASLRLEIDAMRPCLAPVSGLLPSIPAGGSARITFEAGFGNAWSQVPADLSQAVLMLAAHYHEYRTDTALDAGCMPFGVSALIERYRPLRLSGGGL